MILNCYASHAYILKGRENLPEMASSTLAIFKHLFAFHHKRCRILIEIPIGNIPALYVDGKLILESRPIIKYLAREFCRSKSLL